MEMVVSDLCEVTFSIGKHYVSEILCDVVDMDVCHLILGRPWQYDVGAIYDEQANTYSFEWKGKKLRLIPRSPDQDAIDKSPNNALIAVTGKALLNAWKESTCMLALVVKEQACSIQFVKLPKVVDALLKQFADIAPSKLPAGLPPMRAIQHQIEFYPANSIRDVGQATDSREFEPMRGTCFIGAHERRQLEDVHEQLSHKQNYSKVLFPNAADGRYAR
ncbi:uncharacterized protein LOC110095733 [Dendrobium catenatum]|uniref:uncharacterized protein LOC110095733 n=1 Tax=Dendrobium catenatum TaxID=906689 RepID=UPI0009F5A938|nr:uncharacterized protein LOC110095733 [Dendrobium catenatum]